MPLKSITRNTCGCGACGSCLKFAAYARQAARQKLCAMRRPLKVPKLARSAVDPYLARRLAAASPAKRARVIRELATLRGVTSPSVYVWLRRHFPGWSLRIRESLRHEAMRSKS